MYKRQRPGLSASVGIHPHHAAAIQPAWWDRLRELAREPGVVAVGETGLDYHYDSAPRDVQRARFADFVDLAVEVGKPVVCHIRDAHDDALAILAGCPVTAIIHCFTGGPDDARRYVALGAVLSFSGISTFRNADPIRAAARLVPADQILLETDCPYLAPVPNRGKRNEPAFLVHTAELIARERGISVAELAAATTANARRVLVLTSDPGAGIQPPRSAGGA